MLRALKIVSSLNLQSIVCAFDQAIYSKAIEIMWKEQKKFNSCVLMMGMFHMLMMYMHILSKRCPDAGVRDVLIQSSVIAEGSVDKALCGKMYNRGVRMYKLMYEAITRKLFDSVQFDSDEDNRFITHDIEDLSFDQFWEEQGLENHYNKFLDAKESMKTSHTLQFWMSFLEMTELLLNKSTLSEMETGSYY